MCLPNMLSRRTSRRADKPLAPLAPQLSTGRRTPKATARLRNSKFSPNSGGQGPSFVTPTGAGGYAPEEYAAAPLEPDGQNGGIYGGVQGGVHAGVLGGTHGGVSGGVFGGVYGTASGGGIDPNL